MKEVGQPAVPDCLFGELRTLVRLYRGESVFPQSTTATLASSSKVAVVLGAQVLSGGRPSGTLRARSLHAAGLYAAGEVETMIPTGGVGEHPPSEAEVMARILREAGVSGKDILLEEEARSTRESAQLVATMARERGIRSLLLVTDPLHCVRAVEAFRVEGFEAQASPVYSSPMWRKRRLRRGQLLREIGALLWYRMRRGRAKQRAESRFRP
jgi:uncharacterized SAM-binding protein YcdF (DUF218 family)